jgi:exonuclease III
MSPVSTLKDIIAPTHPFSPPSHVSREIVPNLARTPAATIPKALRQNLDIGASLQALLNGSDDGKNYSPVSQGNPDNPNEIWRSQVIRIYFQNVNGLRTFDNGVDILDSLYQMETIRADIFGFAETKLDCRNAQVRSMIHAAKQKVWEHSRIMTCSSVSTWQSLYKPGGTLLGITGPLVGRVRQQVQDDLGRWVGVELLGRDGRCVVVLCAYQVCQKYNNAGYATAYQQQVALLRIRGVDRPNPRAQFVKDLGSLVKEYRKRSFDIILMGDFNEVIGLKLDGMASVVAAGQLTDVQVYCHGLESEQSTYARGPNRVDYFFVSERLLPHVIRQGCEPFNARIFSDHRGLFMDLSYPGFFDRSPTVLAPLSRRNLIYNCVGHVRKYLLYLEKYMSDHNLVDRARQMLTDSRDDDFAVSFDQDFTRGLLAADEHCKNFRRSPWSKTLHEAMTIKFIHLRQLSQLLTGFDMSGNISRLQQLLPVPVPVSMSLVQTRKSLRDAQRHCRQTIMKARDLARIYQDERITAKQLANPDKDAEQIAKDIRKRDATREMWRRIPSSKPKSSGGISMIKVPTDPTANPKDPQTIFRSVVDPSEMEVLLLARNKTHFSQAKDTPLAAPVISDMLGWGGDTATAEALLDGTCDVSELTDNCQARWILDFCERFNDEMPPDISFEDFQDCYLHWRVGTSTSPSGRHLSHQHALFQPHSVLGDTDDDNKFYQETKASLWHAHYACVSYATKHGFCFPRWQQVVNAMIEKEPGNPALHRLRVIHLYENDYNLLLGIKFRQLIRQCQDLQLIHEGCYGGLANRQSLDPVFLEVMQYDYSMLTRYDCIKFANDAGSCYDRIVVSPSNVIARSMGLHRNIASIHGTMLQHATYRIKTQLGVSSESYCHCCGCPIFGTGQGSCSSPLVWCLNCSLYFNVFDRQCYGASFTDMTGDLTLQMGMSGFVDDNCSQTNCHPNNRRSLIGHATHDAQLWSDILWASGGVLEHDKCSYHYLRTDFDRQGAPVLRAGIHGDPIKIRDSIGQTTTLKQLSVYTSYKTLGTYQCPGSRQTGQADALLERSKKHVRTLATSTCQGQSAWMFYSSVFCKSIGYPLAVSRLTDKQLLQIQGPMIPLILNRLGYDRRLAHVLAFGPRQYGGLSITHIRTTKTCNQLSLVIRALRNPGQPRSLTLINFNRIQHTAGVSYPIYEFPRRRLPHLEGTWLIHLRDILSRLDASLQIADVHIFPLQRDHDFFLMDLATTSPSLTDKEIRYINFCRFYLQVLHVSDITTACGTSLAIGIYAGVQSNKQSVSKFNEPYQERPGPQAWQAWRKFLRLFSDSKGRLHRPLGRWLFTSTELQRRWTFMYSPSFNLLYKWRLDTYVVLRQVRSRIFSFGFKLKTMDLPGDCTPVDCTATSDGWRISAFCSVSIPHISEPMIATFDDYLEQTEEYERCQLLRYDMLGHTVFEIVSMIQDSDQYLLVSDGGADRKCGSFGWTLGCSNGHRLAKGWGSVFGYDPKSYRAEISGCRAGLLFLIHAFQFCSVPVADTQLLIYCDNSGFLQKMEKFQEYRLASLSCCLDAEWDLLYATYLLLQYFPSFPILSHVKGHQDRVCPYDDLPLPAQMNIDSDCLASLELEEYGDIHPIVPFDPVSKVMLHIGGRTVTRDLERAVLDKFFLRPLRLYYCDRFSWSREVFDSIDWDLFSSVYSSYPRSRKFFYQFGWKKLPCGARLHRRSARFDDRCPLCWQPQEDDDHLVQCRHHNRRLWRAAFIQGIMTKLSPFLDPELLDMIRIGLSGHFAGDPTSLHQRFPDPSFPSDYSVSEESETVCSAESSSTATSSSSSSLFSHRRSTSTDSLFAAADSLSDPEDSAYDTDNTEFATTYLVSTRVSNDPYIQLRHSQDDIGWDQFLRGKLSEDWNRLQHRYACRHSKNEQSKNWLQWLVRYMASQLYNLWLSRNRDRHGHDSASQYQAKLLQTRRDITEMYSFLDKVLPHDRDLFCSSLDAHLIQPLSQLKGWLAVNKPLILMSVRQAKDQSVAKTPRLTRFFKPSQPSKSFRGQARHRPPTKNFHPTRMTQFAKSITRRRSKLPPPKPPPDASASSPPPSPPLKPRQRYLFDFFPNHPG